MEKLATTTAAHIYPAARTFEGTSSMQYVRLEEIFLCEVIFVALRPCDGCQTRGTDVNCNFRHINLSTPRNSCYGLFGCSGPDPSDRRQSMRSVYSIHDEGRSDSLLPCMWGL